MSTSDSPDREPRFTHKPMTCGVLCLCHSNVGAGQRGDPLTGLPVAEEWRPRKAKPWRPRKAKP